MPLQHHVSTFAGCQSNGAACGEHRLTSIDHAVAVGVAVERQARQIKIVAGCVAERQGVGGGHIARIGHAVRQDGNRARRAVKGLRRANLHRLHRLDDDYHGV